MIGQFTRRSAPVMAVARRSMSSGASNAKEEAAKWAKISYGMIALSGAALVVNMGAHEHEHPRTGLPYQRIRSKPYPWECSDCTLFDSACWAECRGEAPASH